MNKLAAAFIVIFLIFPQVSSPQAAAKETEPPPQDPILRVSPRMHTAPIRRLAANTDCTVLATASEDKTVKLWSLPGGELRRTLRPPIGDLAESNNGKVFAVAVSPDGLWTAAGGWTRTGGDHWVYIFSNATGEAITRLGLTSDKALGFTVQSLAISPDAKYLAAVLSAGGGLRVWERKSGELFEWTAAAADTGYGRKDATGVAFDKNSNLFTVAQDGKIRRYERGKWRGPQAIRATGKLPYSVSVHPDMEKIAVGFTDSASPKLFKTSSLYPLPVAFESGVHAARANLGAVSWSPSGDALFAGGGLKKDAKTLVRVWRADGSDGIDIADVSEDGIFSIIPCGGAVAVSSADPSFGLLKEDGARPFWFNRVSADMRGKLGDDFTVSSDGAQVRFGLNSRGQLPALFDAASNTLSTEETSSADLKPALVSGLNVSGAFDTRTPQIDAALIPLEPNEYSRSLAILPDRSGFFLGTDYGIRYVDKDGGQIWRRQTPGTVWGLNLTQDGKLIVAALGDGTIRWYRAEDRAELLALFVDLPSKRWIAWSPKGYYSASEGAENLLGWHLNRGWHQSADFYEVAKFRDTFYRPDIIKQILPALDEETGIGKANELRKRKRADEDVRKRILPVIEISSPFDGSQISADTVEVTYVLRSPEGVSVNAVIPLIDGKQVSFSRAGQPTQIAPGAITGKLSVSMAGGDAELALVAQSDRGDVSSAKVRLLAFGGIQKPAYRPRLFGLVVGIGHYKPENKAATNISDISFASNDAHDVMASLEAQIGDGKLFREGKVEELTDQNADRASLRSKLSWLRRTTNDPADVIIFYFSGHGKIGEGGASLLLPYDFNGDEDLTTLTKTEVLQILEKTSAKIMVFIDACHGSGGLDTIDFVNSVQSWSLRQAIIFASSRRNQKSYGKGRNSYYTKALLEALSGKSPTPVIGNVVTTSAIDYYLVNRVPGLANPDSQTPIAVSSANWSQIPISAVQATADHAP
jgi:WD40 repeat protein